MQALGEEELSEGGVEVRWPVRSEGLTAQLQALRKALFHKYVQEVAVLKEQHKRELRQLTEEKEQGRRTEERPEEKGERGQHLDSINWARSSGSSPGAAGPIGLEDTQHWERVQEEVAKVGVCSIRKTDKVYKVVDDTVDVFIKSQFIQMYQSYQSDHWISLLRYEYLPVIFLN